MSRVKAKNTSKKKDTNKKSDIKENGDIKGIIYIAVGILLAIAIYTTWAGALSILSREVIYKLVGVSAFVLPLYLIYFGYHSIVSKGSI
ncbi:cell division protein FtsK, partial [Clostridium perfringens]|nr:cell division protein FtsK [Clostridium perfringens]